MASLIASTRPRSRSPRRYAARVPGSRSTMSTARCTRIAAVTGARCSAGAISAATRSAGPTRVGRVGSWTSCQVSRRLAHRGVDQHLLGVRGRLHPLQPDHAGRAGPRPGPAPARPGCPGPGRSRAAAPPAHPIPRTCVRFYRQWDRQNPARLRICGQRILNVCSKSGTPGPQRTRGRPRSPTSDLPPS